MRLLVTGQDTTLCPRLNPFFTWPAQKRVVSFLPTEENKIPQLCCVADVSIAVNPPQLPCQPHVQPSFSILWFVLLKESKLP